MSAAAAAPADAPVTEGQTDSVPATTGAESAPAKADKKPRKPSTAHLKLVPDSKPLRERIRHAAAEVVAGFDRSRTPHRDELRAAAEGLMRRMGLPEGYLGFTMVCVSNEFWRPQLMSVPFERRLLLLPHCLKHLEGCPAEYDEYGLDCKRCGACSIADYKTTAENLGYKVLVAEGTPIVLKIIVSGHVDAVVGVACLNVLEKAIDKVLNVGVPSLAVPLLSSDCKNTSVDADWVSEVIGLRTEAPKVRARSYVPLMREAASLFEPANLTRLIPPARFGPAAKGAKEGTKDVGGDGAKPGADKSPTQGCDIPADPVGGDPVLATEAMAYEYLTFGGKRSRPFITLAAYDALKNGGKGAFAAEVSELQLTDEVRRAAMAIEVFHKASLVHDDIEDDDHHRYGRATLHDRYGIPTAINAGDCLIGMGYRIVGRDRAVLGGEVAADILTRLSDAHVKLSEGQGAELVWRSRAGGAGSRVLSPLDALRIYALKTAPAFEAALYTGIRLAGPAAQYEQAVVQFSRNLGVAFQILNDLQDWREDRLANKMGAGGDVLGGRPTVLMALAMEGASAEVRAELAALQDAARKLGDAPADAAKNGKNGRSAGGSAGAATNGSAGAATNGSAGAEAARIVRRVHALYGELGVFEKAEGLIAKYRAKAESVADEVQPDELRVLLYFLVDSVLDREAEPAGAGAEPVALPLASNGGNGHAHSHSHDHHHAHGHDGNGHGNGNGNGHAGNGTGGRLPTLVLPLAAGIRMAPNGTAGRNGANGKSDGHPHTHSHEHSHDHSHEHSHPHAHKNGNGSGNGNGQVEAHKHDDHTHRPADNQRHAAAARTNDATRALLNSAPSADRLAQLAGAMGIEIDADTAAVAAAAIADRLGVPQTAGNGAGAPGNGGHPTAASAGVAGAFTDACAARRAAEDRIGN